MKIIVTAAGPDLDSPIDPRFGRAEQFVFVDTETMETEALENPAKAAGGGAGVQSAQLIVEKGAEAVLTGNCGPNAFSALAAGEIAVYVGLSGSVRDAVDAFKAGELTPVSDANVQSRFGTGGQS